LGRVLARHWLPFGYRRSRTVWTSLLPGRRSFLALDPPSKRGPPINQRSCRLIYYNSIILCFKVYLKSLPPFGGPVRQGDPEPCHGALHWHAWKRNQPAVLDWSRVQDRHAA